MAQPTTILLVLDFVLTDRTNLVRGIKPLIRAIPSVAVVQPGTMVNWRVEQMIPAFGQWSPPGMPAYLSWEIYFRDGSPFWQLKELARIDTRSTDRAPHSGETKPQPAENEGDYKYGVRLRDPKADAVLSDEDPYLIVRRFR